MVKWLSTTDNYFDKHLKAALAADDTRSEKIEQTVRDIIAAVIKDGNAAVVDFTNRFDHAHITAGQLRVSEQAITDAKKHCTPAFLSALKHAAARIRAYHEKQHPKDERYTDKEGVTLGWKWSAIDTVGLYVPGGTAAYPSSVLMNAIPAQVAGVKRIVMVVPCPGGELNPLVLAAADSVGISEIYRVGGAQAIAALAYGTESIPAVDKIVGPGNAYVAEAKRQVFGKVGIDTIAGPSEILIIADTSAKPEWIAADLLSQAEHDSASRSILVTTDKALGEAVEKEVMEQLKMLPRKATAEKSWQENGIIIVVRDLQEAARISNTVAPEHVEIMIENPESLEPSIIHAGAIFLGHYTPESMGDYTAGPSHVLPTSGAARFSSGLSVYDFIKRSSLISCTENAFQALAENTQNLASEEGLDAHAHAVRVRRK